MITKEIGRFALQSQGIAAIRKDKTVRVLLTSGKTVVIKCPNEQDAGTVINTILYYPITAEHAGHEFQFDVEITIE